MNLTRVLGWAVLAGALVLPACAVTESDDDRSQAIAEFRTSNQTEQKEAVNTPAAVSEPRASGQADTRTGPTPSAVGE